MVDVGLYAPNLDGDKPTALQKYLLNVVDELEDIECVDITLINHRERQEGSIYTGRQVAIDPRPILGERELNGANLDVVHFNGHFTYRLPALLDPPVVVTYHGDIHWENPALDYSSKVGSYARRILDIGLVPQYNKFVFASDDLRIRSERRYAPLTLDTETIAHGVDHETYRPSSGGDVLQRYGVDESYILHLSNFSDRKNPERLLRALKSVSRRFDVQPVIAGGRWVDNDEVESLLADIGLEDTILTGFVPEHDLPALYSNAEVFLFPSLHECFGMPLLEAMACGTPVVTSDRYAMPEVTDGAAELCDPTSVDSIVAAVETVLEDERKRKRMREAGRTVADEHSWKRTASKLADVYEEIAHR